MMFVKSNEPRVSGNQEEVAYTTWPKILTEYPRSAHSLQKFSICYLQQRWSDFLYGCSGMFWKASKLSCIMCEQFEVELGKISVFGFVL